MRICLLTGGGYPYRRDALGDWCHTLVTGLDRHTFELVTILDGPAAARPAYPREPNVTAVRAVPLARSGAHDSARPRRPVLGPVGPGTVGPGTIEAGAVWSAPVGQGPAAPAPVGPGPIAKAQVALGTAGPEAAGHGTAGLDEAAALLCRGLLGEQAYAPDAFAEGLRRLAGTAGGGPVSQARVGSALARPAPMRPADLRPVRLNPGHLSPVDDVPAARHPGALHRTDPVVYIRPAAYDRPAPHHRPATAEPARTGPSHGVRRDPWDGVPLTELLAQAWREGRSTAAVDRLALPRLSLRDAATAAALLRHRLRALTVLLPDVDLVHCVGGTAPVLAALGAHWRTGVPILLTGAWVPVTRQRPGERHLPLAVQVVLRRFRRAVLRTGYAEAGLVAPMSAYQRAWALRHGATPARLVVAPPGVPDPHTPTGPAADRPGWPALIWTGDRPGAALDSVLQALALVLAAAPGTMLYATGITDSHRAQCAAQIARSGLTPAVSTPIRPGPTARHARVEADRVTVHVPEPGEPPCRLAEAMMSGTAVVAVDVADVAETLGDAGILVPAGDPAALADACVTLLRDPARRRRLAAAARARARARFAAAGAVRVYDALYTDLAAPPPAPAYELRLARAPSPPAVFGCPAPPPMVSQEER